MSLALPNQLPGVPQSLAADFTFCDTWFADGVIPQVHDCQMAFNNLPVNENPVPYRPLRRSLMEPKGHLLTLTHNTCQLKLFASGKWVEEHDFTISISPNKVRNMFSRLIEDCVRVEDGGDGGDGGFVTSGLEKTIEWITQQDTEFPGEPGRWIGEPRKLYIPESATFLTAMIWNPRNPDLFEPGANHPRVSKLLSKALELASEDAEDDDPAFAEELEQRAFFLKAMFTRHQFLRPPYWTWWGTRRGVVVPVAGNESLPVLVNATGLQVENSTALELDGFGDGNCTKAGNGLCSVSSRLKRRKKRDGLLGA